MSCPEYPLRILVLKIDQNRKYGSLEEGITFGFWRKVEKFTLFFLYFLLNDTWIHLVSDNICFLRLFIHAPLKNSRFWRPAHCLFFGCHVFFVFLVAMATTSNPIVLARFIPPKWFKNSFHLILRPLSPAPDLLS